jgi:large subunit ribosomal protein L15
MTTLHELKNTTIIRKSRKLLGRGIGSGKGKTSGRGEKGAGSRSGYKRRHGYEGGQFRLFMKIPIRGFSNFLFRKEYVGVNLYQIEKMFRDGETVNEHTLREKGFINGPISGLKILGTGELNKKVKIVADAYTACAKDKLTEAKIQFSIKE